MGIPPLSEIICTAKSRSISFSVRHCGLERYDLTISSKDGMGTIEHDEMDCASKETVTLYCFPSTVVIIPVDLVGCSVCAVDDKCDDRWGLYAVDPE